MDALRLLEVLQEHVERGKLMHSGIFSNKDLGHMIWNARNELKRLRGERCALRSLMTDAYHFLREADLGDAWNFSPSGSDLSETRDKIRGVLIQIECDQIEATNQPTAAETI